MFVWNKSQTFVTTGTINQVALGDINGDGLCDLVVTTFSIPLENKSHPVLVFENTGTNFKNITNTILNGPAVSVHARQILVADINGDHKMDFYIAGHGYDSKPWPGEQSSLLLSGQKIINATSSLVQQISYNHSAALADVNLDGKLDILSGNTYPSGAYLNVNNQSFNKIPVSTTAQTYAFLDVNRDGIVDLFVGNEYNNNSRIVLGEGQGNFKNTNFKIPQATQGWEDMDSQVIDLNNDGLMDLLVSSYSRDSFTGIYTRALIQKADGFIDQTTIYVPYNNTSSQSWRERINLTDINGDGLIDAVVQYAGQNPNGPAPEIWINTGHGFTVEKISHNLNIYSRVAVGDLDNNGTPDIIAINGNTVVSYLNTCVNDDIVGTKGNDNISGNGFGNRIYAQEGNDIIAANNRDTVDGGLGLDTVVLKPGEYSYKLIDNCLSISNFYETISLKNVEQISIGDQLHQVVDLIKDHNQAVYRLYNDQSNKHYFTGNGTHATTLMSEGWQIEEVAFKYLNDQAQDVFRFYNTKNGNVLYTIDVQEKQNILSKLPDWQLQGSDFKAWDYQITQSHPVYRFYNNVTSSYFYTIDENEKIQVTSNSQYVYEGIAFWSLM